MRFQVIGIETIFVWNENTGQECCFLVCHFTSSYNLLEARYFSDILELNCVTEPLIIWDFVAYILSDSFSINLFVKLSPYSHIIVRVISAFNKQEKRVK